MRSLVLCVALASALLTSLAADTAQASIVEAMSLTALTQSSDVIVVARVEEQRARYDAQGRIVTDVTVRIEESLLGRLGVGARANVLRLGGVVGDLGLRVEGEASYQSGETVVLFARWLSTPSGEVLRPVGMAQGVLPIASRGGVELVTPGGAGLELVVRDADGRLTPGQPALRAPVPRDALLEQVRALVAERQRGH